MTVRTMTIELAAETESENLNASAEFFHAWRRGDMARIALLLAPDCEWYRDGERDFPDRRGRLSSTRHHLLGGRCHHRGRQCRPSRGFRRDSSVR